MDGKEKEAYGILRENLQIDPQGLDEALIEHSSLFYQVGRWCSVSQSRMDGARDDRQRMDAELNHEKRQQLEKAAALRRADKEKADRITEAQITAQVEMDPKRIEAEDVMRICQRDLNLWLALKEAYTQRSFMLRSLVQLYVSEYFAVSGSEAGSRTHRKHTTERVKEAAADEHRKLARAVTEDQD